VARDDRSVVDAEVRVAHHLRDETHLAPFFGDQFRELHIDLDVVVEAEEVREDRVD